MLTNIDWETANKDCIDVDNFWIDSTENMEYWQTGSSLESNHSCLCKSEEGQRNHKPVVAHNAQLMIHTLTGVTPNRRLD